MAGRDNVLFHAAVASGTASGTVVPLSLLYGVENVRQGYGTPLLKSVRAYYIGTISGSPGMFVEVKNSNWIDSAGVIGQAINADTALNKDSLSNMRGRDKALQPNTSWVVSATLPGSPSTSLDVYVLFEIEYSDVPGINPENRAGSPVMKKCINTSVTGAANTAVPIGSFDNLLQGVTYVLSEASTVVASGANFLVVEGFSNQRGLTRIIPVKNTGLADQIEGSVELTKQTYNLSMIRNASSSATDLSVYLEFLASKN